MIAEGINDCDRQQAQPNGQDAKADRAFANKGGDKGDEDMIHAFASAIFAGIEDVNVPLPNVVNQANVRDFVIAKAARHCGQVGHAEHGGEQEQDDDDVIAHATRHQGVTPDKIDQCGFCRHDVREYTSIQSRIGWQKRSLKLLS